jgi:hypothetical protein
MKKSLQNLKRVISLHRVRQPAPSELPQGGNTARVR